MPESNKSSYQTMVQVLSTTAFVHYLLQGPAKGQADYLIEIDVCISVSQKPFILHILFHRG